MTVSKVYRLSLALGLACILSLTGSTGAAVAEEAEKSQASPTWDDYLSPDELYLERRIIRRRSLTSSLLFHEYYQGTPDNRLSPRQLYITLGEEELADNAFHVPKGIAVPLAILLPVAGTIGGGALAYRALGLDDNPGGPAGGILFLVAANLGFIVGAGGSYLLLRPYHPVSRSERHELVRTYNEGLQGP